MSKKKIPPSNQPKKSWIEIIIAVASLITAVAAIWIGISSHRTAMRAWVLVTTCALEKELMPDEEIKLKIEITNTGKTPAKKVSASAKFKLVSDRCGQIEIGEPKGVGILPPNFTYPLSTKNTAKISADVFEKIQKEEQWYVGRVVIEYEDVFGKSHRTESRFVYDKGKSFVWCREGQYID